MDITSTIDGDLFRIAIQTTDQARGLDDCLNGLKVRLDQSLDRWPQPNDQYDNLLNTLTDYVRQLAYPSHLSVELLLEHGYVERALKTTSALSNVLEIKRSLIALSTFFLKHEMYERALALIQQLRDEERVGCIPGFVDTCLDNGMLTLLITLTNHLTDEQEKHDIYKCAALSLARRNEIQQAFDMLEYLKDSSEYSSIQSNVTDILARGGHLDIAERLAPVIEDAEDREDAYNSILKTLVAARHEDEALIFIENIPNTDEKIQAAKFIEKSMLFHYDFKSARNLRERFSLPHITYKRAA